MKRKFTGWGVTMCKLGHCSLCLSYELWSTTVSLNILTDILMEQESDKWTGRRVEKWLNCWAARAVAVGVSRPVTSISSVLEQNTVYCLHHSPGCWHNMHVPQVCRWHKTGGVVDSQMAVLPFKGIWTGWGNGQRWVSWNPRKRNTKSFPWEEITLVHAPVHAGGWPSGNQLGREGPECSDGQADSSEPLQPRRLILPCCSDLGRHIWILNSGCCVGLPSTREHMDILEWLQQRATRMIRELDCRVRKVKSLGCSKKVQIQIYQHLNTADEDSKGVRASLYSGTPSDRIRSSGHKLKHRKFHPNTQNHFYTVRVMEHCKSAQRDSGVSLLRDNKKPTAHGPEQSALICTLFEQGLDWTNSRGAHSLSHAGIPWSCRVSTVLQVHWREDSTHISPLK